MLLVLLMGCGVAMVTSVNSVAIAAANRTTTINRHFDGDIFSIPGGQCSNSSSSRAGQCQCSGRNPIFRDDIQQCVDTIDECPLADYVNGAQTEKVPFVFMPPQGHLINANAEISLSDVKAEGHVVIAPVCVVSKSHYLTSSGWIASSENSTALPFALARESERTYLQWLGDPRLRSLLEGRIVLIKLLCKDTSNAGIGVFSPCIAFRVAGSPGLGGSIREEMLLPDAKGLRNADYMAIGISAGLLGLLYVAGLAAYMCFRRRRRRMDEGRTKLTASGSTAHEAGVMRMNPLMMNNQGAMMQVRNSHPHMERHGGFPSRTTTLFEDVKGRHSAVVHPPSGFSYEHPALSGGGQRGGSGDGFFYGGVNSAMDGGMDDKRLFFSPAYFEPELLKSPPPAALEFLSRIRSMIDLAKMRMSSRRFRPILIDIPEENGHYGVADCGMRMYGQYPSGHEAAEHLADVYASTGLIKSMKRRKADEGLVSVNIFAEDNQQNWALTGNEDDVYHPVRMRANVIQKSPLPGRKNAQLADSPDLNFEIYTNPSIEAIYRSLDRIGTNRKQDKPVPVTSARTLKVAMEAGSDDVSDLVSEAESKMPKIESETGSTTGSATGSATGSTAETLPVSKYEVDSLDRPSSGSNRTSLYAKRKSRWKKSGSSQQMLPDSHLQTEETHTNRNWPEDYASSTCTSTKSLSRLLPAEESMEVGNQLFNMDSGAPTLPHSGRKKQLAGTESMYDKISPSVRSHPPENWSLSSTSPQIHPESARNFRFQEQFRKSPATPLSSSASSDTSSSSSHVTVLQESSGSKRQSFGSAFEPDTLERPEFRQHESFIDSLERPQRPKQKAADSSGSSGVTCFSSSSGIESSGSIIRTEELPPPGSVISLCKIYAAKTSATPQSPKKPKRMSSSASGDIRRKAPPPPVSSGTFNADAPPLPQKSGSIPSQSQPPVPNRNLKPSPGSHRPLGSHPHSGRPSAPSLPPKNVQGRSSGIIPPEAHPHLATSARYSLYSQPGSTTGSNNPYATANTSAQVYSRGGYATGSATGTKSSASQTTSGATNHHREQRTGSDTLGSKTGSDVLGSKTGSDGLGSETGSGSLRSQSGNGECGIAKISTGMNVLQRIAQIEEENIRASSDGRTKGMEIALSLKQRIRQTESGCESASKKSLSIRKTWRKLLDKVEDSFSDNEIYSSAASSLVGSLRRASAKISASKMALPAMHPEEDTDAQGSDSESRSSLGSDGTGTASASNTPASALPAKSFYTFGEDMHRKLETGTGSTVLLQKQNSFDSGLFSGNFAAYQTTCIGDY